MMQKKEAGIRRTYTVWNLDRIDSVGCARCVTTGHTEHHNDVQKHVENL